MNIEKYGFKKIDGKFWFSDNHRGFGDRFALEDSDIQKIKKKSLPEVIMYMTKNTKETEAGWLLLSIQLALLEVKYQ